MSAIFVNNIIHDDAANTISSLDRGLLLADGVFETIRVHNTHCLWLDAHIKRLYKSCQYLHITIPYSRDELTQHIHAMLNIWQYDNCALRVTITRGASHVRGLLPNGDSNATVLISGAALHYKPCHHAIIASQVTRNASSRTSGIKTLQYTDNILARLEAQTYEADDAIMLNSNNHIACMSAANIFIYYNNTWITPPLHDGVLPGIARQQWLPLLQAREQSITVAMLQQAQAMMVCNSLQTSMVQTVKATTYHEGHDFDASFHYDVEAIYG